MIGFFYGLAAIFIVLGWNFGGFAFLYWAKKNGITTFKKLGSLALACLAIAWLCLVPLYMNIQGLGLNIIWVSIIEIVSTILFLVSALGWWRIAKMVRQKHADPKERKKLLSAFLVFTTSLIVLIVVQFLIRFF